MPYKLKENARKNKKEYYRKNKDKILSERKTFSSSRKKEKSEYDKKYRLDHIYEFRAYDKAYHDKYSTSLSNRFIHLKATAKNRGVECSLSLEEYVNKVKLPCFYCDDFFPRVTKGGGLDRIDNAKGYQYDNVVSCCKTCNLTRGNRFTQQETKIAIEAIINIRKNGI